MAFFRHQVAAIVATLVDFGSFNLFCSLFAIHASASTIISTSIGASISYTLGRYWAFEATHTGHLNQMIKYAIVTVGSALLNSGGIYILIEGFDLEKNIAKVIIATCIGIPFNFTLHKYWVFK